MKARGYVRAEASKCGGFQANLSTCQNANHQRTGLALLKTKGKMKGYVLPEVTKSRRFRVEFWYMSKHKSSATRDGPADEDHDKKTKRK